MPYYFIRKTGLKLCCSTEDGKTVTKTFGGPKVKDVEDVFETLQKATGVDCELDKKRDLLAQMRELRGDAVCSETKADRDARLARHVSWVKAGMPGVKYECHEEGCDWVDGNSSDFYWHGMTEHKKCWKAEDVAGCVSSQYVKGMLYFADWKDCVAKVTGRS